MPTGQDSQDLSWLAGGGEMGQLIRAFDWSTTPLGPIAQWPQSLKTSVSLCLSSTFPILLAWGPEDIQIYNDAYRPICGPKHPEALGMPFKVCWATALPVVGGAFDRAHRGEGAYIKDQQMMLDRFGYLEEAFMTFSFGPVRVETGEVGGIFHPITETTEATLNARRTKAIREISLAIGTSKSVKELVENSISKQKDVEYDLPYFLFYELNDAGDKAKLIGSSGLTGTCNFAKDEVTLEDPTSWPLASAMEESFEVKDVRSRFGDCVAGPFEDLASDAVILPLRPAGMKKPYGFLVAGVSSRRALDVEYQSFYSLLASAVTSVISNIRAYEEELKKAEALAEIDRAKTTFFSNVSHEFRTPLTLILGPLEDSLKDTTEPLSAKQRERQEVTHRNATRLLKLVNSLLDFSRIEAGRIQANFVPTNLSKLTGDLASVFRSATDRAGIDLQIATSTVGADLGQDIYVDPEMWEKIVLNLISNAFKFTFEGSIHVSLRNIGPELIGREAVQLRVSDTGIGVSKEELPKLFERFHRVQGAQGRSFEGSGIGLALVQELVKLHGGQIMAESDVGKGTTFIVTIPRGSEHLPQAQVSASKTLESTGIAASAYVNEAERWLPIENNVAELSEYLSTGERRARVLLVDDNADMREYVAELLRERYLVETAADGLEALAKVRLVKPDLVLSDVMMPRMDGFQFLAELRKDISLTTVPVVMLSARAGEEARLEGLSAGADDYLVKPFSARELLTRVDSVLKKDRVREEAHTLLKESEERFRSMFQNTSVNIALVDLEGNILHVNEAFQKSLGYEAHELVGHHFSHITHPEDVAANTAELSRLINGAERAISFDKRYLPKNGGVHWVRTTISRYESEDQKLRYLIAISQDIGDSKLAEHLTAAAREEAVRANQSKSAFLANMSHEIRTPLGVIKGFADLLTEAALPTHEATSWAKTIKRNAEELTTIINDILDLSKIEAGKMELETIDFDLASLLDEVRTLTEFKAREKGISVEIRVSPLVPEKVATDPTRLRQLLLNIVGNGVKFTNRGRVAVDVLSEKDNELVFRISDTGIGIDSAQVGKLFQPFSQADGSVTRLFGGTGLGLAFSKKLANALGGDLNLISSEPGRGSVFEFSITTHELGKNVGVSIAPSNSSVANIITQIRPTLASPLAGVQILLVEDSADNQALITRYLRAAGASVTTADDGEHGIEKALASPYDIVLMDIQMPKLDGLSAMSELRKQGYKKPIVALTAHAMREERERALSAGFDGYLTKPIDRKTLIETLASLSF